MKPQVGRTEPKTPIPVRVDPSFTSASPGMLERMRPHLAAVAVRVERATRARAAAGLDPEGKPSGAEVFPDSAHDAVSWDNLSRRVHTFSLDDLVVTFADLLALEEMKDGQRQQAPGSA